ncbi:unannotated protein [freshwater metagenome]|uniref:Unannotated protein n=1 Tax=freshwater metagenome TaxID=449393 RepID=A0A6J7HRL1_9ZZZZ
MIASALFGGEYGRGVPGAVFVFPAPETAGERDDVGVAEGFEGLGREGGTRAAGAVDDDLLVVIRNSIFDLGFELAAGDK